MPLKQSSWPLLALSYPWLRASLLPPSRALFLNESFPDIQRQAEKVGDDHWSSDMRVFIPLGWVVGKTISNEDAYLLSKIKSWFHPNYIVGNYFRHTFSNKLK